MPLFMCMCVCLRKMPANFWIIVILSLQLKLKHSLFKKIKNTCLISGEVSSGKFKFIPLPHELRKEAGDVIAHVPVLMWLVI